MEKFVKIYVPEEATQVLDRINLESGDTWMLLWEDPPRIGGTPLLCIEQYQGIARQNEPLRSNRINGSVWFQLEDLPAVVEKLTYLRNAFQPPAGDRTGQDTCNRRKQNAF